MSIYITFPLTTPIVPHPSACKFHETQPKNAACCQTRTAGRSGDLFAVRIKLEEVFFYNIFHFLGPAACAAFQVWRTKHTHTLKNTHRKLACKKSALDRGLCRVPLGSCLCGIQTQGTFGKELAHTHTCTHLHTHTHIYLDNCNSRKTLGEDSL